MDACPICGSDLNPSISKDYIACFNCGHEVLVSGQSQTTMVNDDLNYTKIVKADSNVKAQLRCLNEVGVGKDCLIDVGCGSGKFLYHSQNKFSRVLGIEISKKPLKFATEELGLNIENELPSSIDSIVSVVTFWHSLEHIPAENYKSLFENLSSICSVNTRVIISVPNAASIQYNFFKEGFAYYDVPNHLHQFTTKSLDLLMSQYGFLCVSNHKMPSYDLFGYMQGLLNKFVYPTNFLYYALKRNFRNKEMMKFRKSKIFISLFLSGLFLPFSILLTIYDQLNPNRASVITRCYRKCIK